MATAVDLGAEQSVLGAMMLDHAAIEAVREHLQPEDFSDDRHGPIYLGCLALAERDEAIDFVTLRNELGRQDQLHRIGGADYLAELTTVTPAATSARHYADIVVRLAIARRLTGFAARTAAAASTADPTDIEGLLSAAQDELWEISQRGRQRRQPTLPELLRETWQEMELQLNRRAVITGVPTGFRELNRMTQGFQPAELVLLAARPSVGKTAMALCIARSAAKAGIPVEVFSLEMSAKALSSRLLCSEAGINRQDVVTGGMEASGYQKIAAALDLLGQLPINIDATSRLSVATMRSRIRRRQAKGGVGLVIVDYLQLLDGRRGERNESDYTRVTHISNDLKALATELELPVIALSQLSRDSEKRSDKRPQLSDLRESGALEQDSDLVLMLYREGMHNAEVDKSVTELVVAKNRNGPIGDVPLIFVPELSAFAEPFRAAGGTRGN